MLDQNNHQEDFVTIKGVNPNNVQDIIMHPALFNDQNEFAVVVSITGMKEVKRIKLVPGKTPFPNFTRYRTFTKQVEVSTPTGDAGEASDTMMVFSVSKRPIEDQPGQLEYFVEKQVYSADYLDSLE
jgi:hypothetical protein